MNFIFKRLSSQEGVMAELTEWDHRLIMKRVGRTAAWQEHSKGWISQLLINQFHYASREEAIASTDFPFVFMGRSNVAIEVQQFYLYIWNSFQQYQDPLLSEPLKMSVAIFTKILWWAVICFCLGKEINKNGKPVFEFFLKRSNVPKDSERD